MDATISPFVLSGHKSDLISQSGAFNQNDAAFSDGIGLMAYPFGQYEQFPGADAHIRAIVVKTHAHVAVYHQDDFVAALMAMPFKIASEFDQAKSKIALIQY